MMMLTMSLVSGPNLIFTLTAIRGFLSVPDTFVMLIMDEDIICFRLNIARPGRHGQTINV